MKTREQLIDELNSLNIKNQTLESLKEDINNWKGSGFNPDKVYDAMLDNIVYGSHSKRTFEYNGKEWEIRLLSGKEFNHILKVTHLEAIEEKVYEDWNLHYKRMVKIVTTALNPPGSIITKQHEEKIEGLTYGTIERLYLEYMDFDQISNSKPSEFTMEEIELFVDVVKKKPEDLKNFDRWTLLIVVKYLTAYCVELETKMQNLLSSDTNN